MLVFIDESGDHNLNYQQIDDPYDIFVLGAVCITEESYEKFDLALKSLKEEFFGDDTFILHTVEMTRPTKSKQQLNVKFSQRDFRKQFYVRINKLIKETNFELIACIVQKKVLQIQKGANTIDPYIYSLNVLLDQILNKCDDQTCKIYPEKRAHTENMKIELELLRARNLGTDQFSGEEVSNKIDEFKLQDKKTNMSGLQLIDLLVTPIGRHHIGKKKTEPGNEVLYDIVSEKIQKGDLIIYP